MPSSLKQPIKLEVLRWPCGTEATSRSPMGAPAVSAHHVGLDRRLVEKDQPPRPQASLVLPPCSPRCSDIRTLLLGGVQRLFLASGRACAACRASARCWP